MTAPTNSSATNGVSSGGPGARVVFVPGPRFFVRRIPLVAGRDADQQAALALESIGPFAPGQLYYGFHASPGGDEAIVFAVYRRNIRPEETSTWAEADAVLPAFALWLAQPAPATPEVRVHVRPTEIVAVAWDGRAKLPSVVLAREVASSTVAAVREELVTEARRRIGALTATVREAAGEPMAGELNKLGLTLRVGEHTCFYTSAQLRALDVRDKSELADRAVRGRRDRRLWLAFAGSVSLLAACVALELGLLVGRAMMARQITRQEAVRAEVRGIEEASRLAARMEQLAAQSSRPLEMLATVNTARPPSLEFVRASTSGPLQMEIEAH